MYWLRNYDYWDYVGYSYYKEMDVEIHGTSAHGISIETHNFIHILNNSMNKKKRSRITPIVLKKAMSVDELKEYNKDKKLKMENRKINSYLKSF